MKICAGPGPEGSKPKPGRKLKLGPSLPSPKETLYSCPRDARNFEAACRSSLACKLAAAAAGIPSSLAACNIQWLLKTTFRQLHTQIKTNSTNITTKLSANKNQHKRQHFSFFWGGVLFVLFVFKVRSHKFAVVLLQCGCANRFCLCSLFNKTHENCWRLCWRLAPSVGASVGA